MLSYIQVTFRVLVRYLRTNNEFMLRVLIYREFTERCSGAEVKRQLKKMQKRASTE
ncbi:hypothetical protein MTR67_007133, partial [Solanum verrucosum]